MDQWIMIHSSFFLVSMIIKIGLCKGYRQKRIGIILYISLGGVTASKDVREATRDELWQPTVGWWFEAIL
jgi:hypothetical protein